ncbi:helix-turn-helix domain-containing protein [Neomegalonema perideroedes]|uniref:helix-turn-helix domain-containing protein n=1 Tax=Neomegalonema perideroedes TaxID=217219 RepID=UPI000A01CE5D|nr:helix-turn-helix transcriptional regulator [Neomegalonema perideroedes]
MKNRIRVFRQRNGMTLRELAEAVGTTPQSVSRLETGNMTLSTDWLERFATVLKVHPVDLLEGPGSRLIQMLGDVDSSGDVTLGRETGLSVDVPAEDPVAARIEEAYGPYSAGDILIGDRMRGDIARAYGRDCLVMADDEAVMLRRVLPPPKGEEVEGQGLRAALASLRPARDPSQAIVYDAPLLWVAPLIMRVTHL